MIRFFVTKIFTAALLFVFMSPAALAQTEIIPATPDNSRGTPDLAGSPLSFAGPGVDALPNTVNCFDYYTFGSVQVDIEPEFANTVSGVPLTFVGRVVNYNPYPIVGGQVLVKIYKTTETIDGGVYQNGYPVVDQFFAIEDVTIPANGSTPVSFDWNIPKYLLSGEYELSTFFMTEKRFNLLGLPFTDDVTGNKANFTILGQAPDGIDFDKNSVTLNDESYSFAAFPPTFTATDTIEVKATLINDTDGTKTVPVSWTLYNWAGERVENKLDAKTETITLAAGEEKVVSYKVLKSAGAVSFVQAIATYKDTKSILNVRFNRADKSEIRLNFPSIQSYPLVAGQEATVFSCLHSTSQPIVEGGKLVLTLTDPAGSVINTYTYEGGITGAMMGVKSTFVPEQDITDFTLTASLYQNDKIVEEVKVDYKCSDIDETLCPKVSQTMATGDVASIPDIGILIKMGGVILLVLMIGVIWFLKKRYDKRYLSENFPISPLDTTTMVLIWFCLLPLSAAVFLAPQSAQAKSVQYSDGGSTPVLYHNYNSSRFNSDWNDSSGNDWHAGLNPSLVTVTYRAEIVDFDTGAVLTSADPVPVGTKFRVRQYNRNVDTDISWASTGYSFDSPYGRWELGATPPASMSCWAGYYQGAYIRGDQSNGTVYTGRQVGWNYAEVFGYLSVNPPTPVVVSPSSNLSCSGNICTVIAPGPVTVGLQFPTTFGKFYFRYRVYQTSKFFADLDDGVCYGGNTPMRSWGSNSDFVLDVPEQTINFNLRAQNPSRPPTAPTITPRPTNTYLTGDNQVFALVSTDPDGDQIRYVSDWNNDGVVDGYIGGSGYRDSGTSVYATYSWLLAGTYTFQFKAQDSTGTYSAWSPLTVTITEPPPTVNLNVTGCTIPLDGVNCSGNVDWQYSRDYGTYLVSNITTSFDLGTTENGNVPVVLQEGSNTIEAVYDGTVLDSKTVVVDCISGTAWYGGACIDSHEPVLTIKLEPPIVRMNGAADVSWTISDLTNNTCVLNGPNNKDVPITAPTGRLLIGPISSVSEITLTCVSDFGLFTAVEELVVVEVVPTATEI